MKNFTKNFFCIIIVIQKIFAKFKFVIQKLSENYYKINLLKTYDMILNDYLLSYDSIKYICNINYIKTNIFNLF